MGTGSTSFTVRVNSVSLCALSRRFVSNAALAESMCQALAAAETSERLGSPSGKAAALRAYQRAVDAAQRAGFLSPERAALLSRLASAL